MKIIYGIIKFDIDKKIGFRDIEKLRGNIIRLYRENMNVHNHNLDGKSIYKFPEFQYKIINRKLSIMLFNENINFIMKVYTEIDNLIFDNKEYKIKKNLELKEYEIKYLKDELMEYEFISDYIPFNQVNFKKYLEGEYPLEKGITNNILEFLKAVNIYLDKNEKIITSNIIVKDENYTVNKNVKFKTFRCKFKLNIDLPSYISLGKRKSIGYGVIRKVVNNGNFSE